MHRKTATDSHEALPGPAADDVVVPGLTPRHGTVRSHADDVFRRLAALQYRRTATCLWLVFIGGTGTGKSTLFNALCGREVSRTGVERPKTLGPLAYTPAGAHVENGFPFPELSLRSCPTGAAPDKPQGGAPGTLTLLEHEEEGFSHLVLVDTPDLDSLEEENRLSAVKLALLADAVVFVTSQEKYADEVPSVFLRRAVDEGGRLFVLLNKADEGFSQEDALDVLTGQGIPLPRGRLWIVPRSPSPTPEVVSNAPAFQDFRSRLLDELASSSLEERRAEGLGTQARALMRRMDLLIEVLEAEEEASETWLEHLEDLYQTTTEDLIQTESDRFASRSRSKIQREIRRLFSRYDLLARPRLAVRNLLRAPLRLAGWRGGKDRPGEELEKARSAENLAPVLAAVDRFGRRALEELSPSDERAPLFTALRRPGVIMGRDEVEARVIAEQERLEAWLRETFEEMARGLPTAKKWSIYSTSVLWGILVLALEATLGGGFTVIDALLGSALAPFLTKGSAELFAYREIRKVVRDMAYAYRRGLVAILEEQRDRYASALRSVKMPGSETERIRELRRRLNTPGNGKPFSKS